MVSEDEVWAALDAVVDLELGVPMEGLELIDEVDVQRGEVTVTFHLTSAMCPPPMMLDMANQIKEVVNAMEQIRVKVKDHMAQDEINRMLEEDRR